MPSMEKIWAEDSGNYLQLPVVGTSALFDLAGMLMQALSISDTTLTQSPGPYFSLGRLVWAMAESQGGVARPTHGPY